MPTVPSKPITSTNFTQKIVDPLSIINGNLNHQHPINKDITNIPKPKILVNHVRIPTIIYVETKDTSKTMKHIKDIPQLKETMITKEIKDNQEITINNQRSPKVKLIPNRNDMFEKEQANIYDKNNKKLALKTRRRVDTTNNTTVFPIK